MNCPKTITALKVALQDNDSADLIDEPFILLTALLTNPRFTYSTLR